MEKEQTSAAGPELNPDPFYLIDPRDPAPGVLAVLAGAVVAPFWTIGMALIYCDESEQARATAA